MLIGKRGPCFLGHVLRFINNLVCFVRQGYPGLLFNFLCPCLSAIRTSVRDTVNPILGQSLKGVCRRYRMNGWFLSKSLWDEPFSGFFSDLNFEIWTHEFGTHDSGVLLAQHLGSRESF